MNSAQEPGSSCVSPATQLKREWSLRLEFGWIPGNLCDLNLTCPATQSSLWEPCPARMSLRDIPAAYGDGGGSLWRVFLVSRRRSSKLVRSRILTSVFLSQRLSSNSPETGLA